MNKKMFRLYAVVFLSVLMVLTVSSLSFATNGDNLIGVGSGSREMGGTGIAAPQDAVGGIYSNPAAVAGEKINMDFMGTLFIPSVTNKATVGNLSYSADSASKVYTIPSVALTIPVSTQATVGIAAYGVSGLGVDYRGTNVDNTRYYDFSAMYGRPAGSIVYPLESGTYTNFNGMQFAPFVRYKVNDQFSVGVAGRVNYSMLDLGTGTSQNYGIGAKVGILYKPMDTVSLGLTYSSPIEVNYKSVSDFDGNGTKDNLKLEQPQEVGFGIAFEPIKDKFLIETDLKWINWADATGYKDFDWSNQLVVGAGLQFKPVQNLALRAGYNYGKNPVDSHSNFTGSKMMSMQGYAMPTYYYESFRITGFPAFVEHHLTLGLQYTVAPQVSINVGYMHAFNKSMKETGTNMAGAPTSFESSLSEDSIELGVKIKL
ncbi:MAG: outer membrane protein transport protein [Nitrospirae bacterium]|nr:outer membrane protein transport protein [Nitrospirota bacterium]MBF0591135.1 outer membrane protein transport protein [Nitrospirota bacterium]